MEHRKNSLPVDTQLEIVERKLANGNTPNLPLWKLAEMGYGRTPDVDPSSCACIRRSSDIAETPQNMGEALNRQFHLQTWIRAGRDADSFYESFGPPKGATLSSETPL